MGTECTLPISDCGAFLVGDLWEIIKEPLPDLFDEAKPRPKYAVIIWYDDKETARAACNAVLDAHYK